MLLADSDPSVPSASPSRLALLNDPRAEVVRSVPVLRRCSAHSSQPAPTASQYRAGFAAAAALLTVSGLTHAADEPCLGGSWEGRLTRSVAERRAPTLNDGEEAARPAGGGLLAVPLLANQTASPPRRR